MVRSLWCAAALCLASGAPSSGGGAGAGPFDGLAAARVVVDSAQRSILIELPPIDLPGQATDTGAATILPPACVADVPVTGALFSARVEVVDLFGNTVPRSLLREFTLVDPARRELFRPVALRVLGAGPDTPEASVSRFLLGVPIAEGQRWLVRATLVNTSATAYQQLRVRAVLRYEPEHELWPVFSAFPWSLSVAPAAGGAPVGGPDRSSESFEATPAVAGTIVAFGAHLPEDGVAITFTDAATGLVLGRIVPVRDSRGRVLVTPVTRLYSLRGLGIHVAPGHRYRVTASYDTATGRPPQSGAAIIAGLVVPDRGTSWPLADTTDSAYRADLDALRHPPAPGPPPPAGAP